MRELFITDFQLTDQAWEQPMNNLISNSPELVRMAQMRYRNSTQLKNELARLAVESYICQTIDPELDILIDEGASMSRSLNLSVVLGVNDIVVNGHRLDVRAIEDGNKVSINRTLVGSQYLSLGTIVVRMHNLFNASVIGFIGAGVWMKAEDAQKSNRVEVQLETSPDAEQNYDFTGALQGHLAKQVVKLPDMSHLKDVKAEVNSLLNDSEHLISARRKQVFNHLCAHWDDETCDMVESIKLSGSDMISHVLSDAARWNAAVERLCDKLAPRFQSMSRNEIRDQILKQGEIYGGQFAAPSFRSGLLSGLAQSQLKADGKQLAPKVQTIMNRIMAGGTALDAVKQLVTNKAAVELAGVIKKERKKVSGFVAASAEEIGMAFQKLALQPAYATHSSADGGIESINEALVLLEVGEMAQAITDLELT